MNRYDDIRRIERDLAQDRDALARSLQDLRASLTLGGLVGQGAQLVEDGYTGLKDQGAKLLAARREGAATTAPEAGAEATPDAEGAQVAERGADLAGTVAGAAGAEAAGPTAQGLAQGLGQGVAAAGQLAKEHPLAAAALGGALSWMVQRLTAAGPPEPAPASDQRLADLFEPGAAPPDEDEFWIAEADRLRARAADLLELLEDAVTRGDAPLEDIQRWRQEVRQSLALDTRRVMMRGLEGLEGAARDKAFRRREALYARHLGVAASGGGWVKPVAVGTLVAGSGLALAMLLPRSSTEVKVLADMRDKLVGEVSGFMKANPAISSVVTTRVLGGVVSALMRKL